VLLCLRLRCRCYVTGLAFSSLKVMIRSRSSSKTVFPSKSSRSIVLNHVLYVKQRDQAKRYERINQYTVDDCFRRARKEKIMFIAGAVFIKIKLLLSSVCSSVYSKSPNPSQQQDSNSTERCFEHNHSDNDDGVHYHT
jgi:hypothetical protein